jgi:hypothetical protein
VRRTESGRRGEKEKTIDDEQAIIKGNRLTKELHDQSCPEDESVWEGIEGALVQFDR